MQRQNSFNDIYNYKMVLKTVDTYIFELTPLRKGGGEIIFEVSELH